MAQFMLTTVDNPFNPFEDFDEWLNYDYQHGYHTCEYLARIAKTSSEGSEADYEDEMEYAIDEIVRVNPLGIHIKVGEDGRPKPPRHDPDDDGVALESE